MPHIVIIGASCAGHHLACAVRRKNKACTITLINDEPYPGYDRRKLLPYFCGTVKEKELFLCAPDFYAQQGITFLKDSKALSVNPGRRSVSCRCDETRRSLEYDLLAVCSGTKTPLPDIDGINKSGVFRFESLAEFKEARSQVLSDAVCIIGCNSRTVSFARALTERGLEVKLVCSETVEGLPSSVDVIPSEVIQIIGEAGVQAVKLKEGKIIGASLVAVMSEPRPATEFLQGSGVELAGGAVVVDESMGTSVFGIFSCGTASVRRDQPAFHKSWDQTVEESARLAEHLTQRIGG